MTNGTANECGRVVRIDAKPSIGGRGRVALGGSCKDILIILRRRPGEEEGKEEEDGWMISEEERESGSQGAADFWTDRI